MRLWQSFPKVYLNSKKLSFPKFYLNVKKTLGKLKKNDPHKADHFSPIKLTDKRTKNEFQY
jgi:hypothetical protein